VALFADIFSYLISTGLVEQNIADGKRRNLVVLVTSRAGAPGSGSFDEIEKESTKSKHFLAPIRKQSGDELVAQRAVRPGTAYGRLRSHGERRPSCGPGLGLFPAVRPPMPRKHREE
jgi:hypothetical protein